MQTRWLKRLVRNTKIYTLANSYFQGYGSIVKFQRVTPPMDGPRLKANALSEITPERLDSTVRHFLRKDYAVLSLDELHERLTQQNFSKPFVCFTFDGGYIDNLERVCPILKQYHLPFTTYVNPCFPEKTVILWRYMLEDLLLEHTHLEFEYDDQRFNYSLSSLAEKEEAYLKLSNLIQRHPLSQLHDITERLFKPFHIFPEDYLHYTMNWDQVIELSQSAQVTIGAHTSHHLPLSEQAHEERYHEMMTLKTDLEEKLGCPIEHLAYLNKGSTQAVQRKIEEKLSGQFKTITTGSIGHIFKKHQNDKFCLPRIPARDHLRKFP